MLEGGKKSWEGKTLEELKDDYEKSGISLGDFEKSYEPIEKKQKNISGLGEITFRLNLASYFNLEDVIKEGKDRIEEQKSIYKELYGKKYDFLSKGIDTRFKKDANYIRLFYQKAVTKILDDNIKTLKDVMEKYEDAGVKGFSKQLIKSIERPVIYFGATDDRNSSARYNPVKDIVVTDVDKRIRYIRSPIVNMNQEEYEKNVIADISHEFLHRYDTKKLEVFFSEHCQNVANDLQAHINKNIGDKDKAEMFCNMLNKKMEQISKIMEGIKPGWREGYMKEIKVSAKIDPLKYFALTIEAGRKSFEKFIREIIPNICSEVAFKNNCETKFTTALIAVAEKNKEVFTGEGLKEFAFLKNFFAKYEKAAEESELTLPTFLKEGIKAVEDAYIRVFQ